MFVHFFAYISCKKLELKKGYLFCIVFYLNKMRFYTGMFLVFNKLCIIEIGIL